MKLTPVTVIGVTTVHVAAVAQRETQCERYQMLSRQRAASRPHIMLACGGSQHARPCTRRPSAWCGGQVQVSSSRVLFAVEHVHLVVDPRCPAAQHKVQACGTVDEASLLTPFAHSGPSSPAKSVSAPCDIRLLALACLPSINVTTLALPPSLFKVRLQSVLSDVPTPTAPPPYETCAVL